MDNSDLFVRDRAVRFDPAGLAKLNDIWAASGAPKNRTPSDWLRLPTTTRFVGALATRITGKSRDLSKSEMRSVYYKERGIGTFGDVRLAVAYAEYLDPHLAVEVREVFLRFKMADATLADDLLERATVEANEWVARRAISRAVRNQYTSQLSHRGVRDGREYSICTNETYQRILGGTAKQVKVRRQLPDKANLRDSLSLSELAYLAASEALAVERMEDEDSQGFVECQSATIKSAGVIGGAINADRMSRRKAA